MSQSQFYAFCDLFWEKTLLETPRKIRAEPLDAAFSPLWLHEDYSTFIQISFFGCLSG